MKKSAVILVLASLVMLAACGVKAPETVEPAPTAAPTAPVAEDVPAADEAMLPGQGTDPVKVEVIIDTEGYKQIAVFTDAEELAECMRLYNEIEIGDMTDMFTTDSYSTVRLYARDGTCTVVGINYESLEKEIDGETHIFELKNFGKFWSYANAHAQDMPEINAPAGSIFGSIKADGNFLAAVQKFNDGSVESLRYYADNAADLTINDTARIQGIWELLSKVSAGTEVEEPGIDDGLIVFEFSFKDSSTYMVSFLTSEYVYGDGSTVYEVTDPDAVRAAMKAAA